MEPTSKEPLPTLPRPERGGPRVDELEMISAPEETFEKGSLPSESLRQASDAVSQAYVAGDGSVLEADSGVIKQVQMILVRLTPQLPTTLML